MWVLEPMVVEAFAKKNDEESLILIVTVTIRDVTGLHGLLYHHLHHLFSSFLFALLLLYVLLFSFDVISYISFRPS